MQGKSYYKTKCDTLISKIVRMAGQCDMCGRKAGDIQLQCAHVVGRSNHTLRYDLFNVLPLCAGCHRKWHNDPLGAVMWFDKKYPNRREHLDINKNKLTKRTLKDYKELSEMLQQVYERKSL